MHIVVSTERIVLALWVGGLWSIGFLAAPELFRSLESRQAAGAIAGNLFTTMSYVGLVAGSLLLLLAHNRYRWHSYRQWRTGLVLLMLTMVTAGQFVVTPMMREIKQERLATALVSPKVHRQFAVLHSVSSALYLLTSVCGLVLVAAGATRRAD